MVILELATLFLLFQLGTHSVIATNTLSKTLKFLKVENSKSNGGRPIAVSTLPLPGHSFRLRRNVFTPINGHMTALPTSLLTKSQRVKPSFRSKRKLLKLTDRKCIINMKKDFCVHISDVLLLFNSFEKQSIMLTEKLSISRPISIYIAKVGSQAALSFSQKLITFVQLLTGPRQYGGDLASEIE
ncbi:hypothetical protein VP01_2215g1 [Puccinia sorghi]|uniref:Uncharacterized protein n=1 Tax=Puccinia sorghi TaxID=27349 RepID=A0A0L6V8Q6_9BASI|nr:hypothetical protein VP01_2215g1 [Puccinia sorghi]